MIEKKEIKKWQKTEEDAKDVGNISIDIRKTNTDISYLSMDGLANLLTRKIIINLLLFQEMQKSTSLLEML